MVQVWSDLPVGRAIRLTGAHPDALALLLDPLPDDAPAVVTYRPRGVVSVAAIVREAVDELEQACVRLFPVWLPGSEGITGPAGAGTAAVRSLARSVAPASAHYGPFLADLAEHALRGRVPVRQRFAPEVRAAGLARVVARAYDRASAALLVIAPDGLGPTARDVLVDACEWLADRGDLGVWLVADDTVVIERLMPVRVAVPSRLAELDQSPSPADPVLAGPAPDLPTLSIPQVAGSPTGGSPSEQALEVALARHEWATGRVWHQKYQPTDLDVLRFFDLLWEREKVVVEVDGPEHRTRLKWTDDRLRDNQLQHDGYIVLRYPNERIGADLAAVLHDIHAHLSRRRSSTPEGIHYAHP